MIEFNSSFWNKMDPGYYDRNFDNLNLTNNVQHLWHYLTFLKQIKFLTSDKNHLDYACGPGTQIGLFSKSNSLGYDPSEQQITYAKKKYKTINKNFTSNLEDLFTIDKFDVITINGLFEYLNKNELAQLLTQIKNYSKAGTKILITTPNYSGFFPIIEYLSKFFGIINYEMVNKTKFKKKSLESFLVSYGAKNLKVIKIINVGVFLAIFNSRYAIKTENLIENVFKNKIGFLLMAEFEI
tara:strand:- start:65 stop:781 length:717 start_codon:yes stop_codon:yes gene_type:complete